MKKIFAFLPLVCLAFLSFNYSEKSLINVVAEEVNNYVIIESDETYQVLEIDASEIDKILSHLNVEIINKKNVSGRLIIEGFSLALNDYIIINNRKINIQISIDDDSCLIGYPLIKNSF